MIAKVMLWILIFFLDLIFFEYVSIFLFVHKVVKVNEILSLIEAIITFASLSISINTYCKWVKLYHILCIWIRNEKSFIDYENMLKVCCQIDWNLIKNGTMNGKPLYWLSHISFILVSPPIENLLFKIFRPSFPLI